MPSTRKPTGNLDPVAFSIRRSKWRTAHRRTFGSDAEEGWLKDMDAAGLEVYMAKGETMVVVDRDPIRTDAKGNSFLRSGVLGTGANTLNLVGGPEHITESVTHGVYGGRMGRQAVQMDQYVKIRNGVPVGIVRILQRSNGPSLYAASKGIVERFLGTY